MNMKEEMALNRPNETKGSKPVYPMTSEKNISVPMRDGTRLSINFFRPQAEGKFPVLLAYSPYGKEVQSISMQPQPPTSVRWRGYLEAGNSEYIVSRGYVHIIADIRGTGQSEGTCHNLLSKQEAEDGYDLIEWIAQQPWCDGNVGMMGISYFAMTQMIVAAEQPPHLKAIFPYDTPADIYRHGLYDGGILSLFYMNLWPLLSARDFVSDMVRKVPPHELKRLVEEAQKEPDMMSKPETFSILLNPRMNPLFFDFLVNPLDGPFYWERSAYTKYDKIKIPVYCGSGWYAYRYIHLLGAFANFNGLSGPKELIIGPPTALERPFHQYHDVIIRWFDHWLKGIDTGIMNEPPIKLFVRGTDQWRYENEWPLSRTKWTKYYLRSWGRLTLEPEEWINISPDCYAQPPLTVTNSIQSLTYVTAPMKEDTEVTGPMALYLYASISSKDTNWIVTLKDVGQDATEVELTRGWLKASHRALDIDKSKPYQPYHTHTKPEPITPGEIYEYAIEIRPTSNVFKTGHRIKLEIMSADLPGKTIFEPDHLNSSHTTIHYIYHDKKYDSSLLLPIIRSKKL
jgi:predicted acyl esterase